MTRSPLGDVPVPGPAGATPLGAVDAPTGDHHGERVAAQDREPRSVVRPYVLTRGRTTSPAGTFELHAPVLALVGVDGLDRSATPEERRIVELAQTPVSIAELGARVGVPVGVVRVLVGDLSQARLVTVRAVEVTSEHRDIRLLERLLEGIRAL